jgi:hypothetical protein
MQQRDAVFRSCYKEDNWGNQVSSVREAVRKSGNWKGAVIQRGLEPGSEGITNFRSSYQETSSENTVRWNNFARFIKCGNNDSVLVIFSYDLFVVNKSNHQKPHL